jgi:hypothetical protein
LSSRRVNEGQAGILKVPDVVDGDDLVLKERLHEYRRRCQQKPQNVDGFLALTGPDEAAELDVASRSTARAGNRTCSADGSGLPHPKMGKSRRLKKRRRLSDSERLKNKGRDQDS